MTSEINIYIADLAAYNSGILHGFWIDACASPDEMQEQIDSLLKLSPIDNAEEVAIHDHEGFEGAEISEYEGLESVHNKAIFIKEYGLLGAEILGHCCDNLDEATTVLEDSYHGEYASVADFAQNLTEETSEIPKHLEF